MIALTTIFQKYLREYAWKILSGNLPKWVPILPGVSGEVSFWIYLNMEIFEEIHSEVVYWIAKNIRKIPWWSF